jgi:hypothetical protein
MKAYEAIFRAAAHIDEHPALYDFNRTKVPRDCNTPACVLGWIGFFAGRFQARIRARFGFSFVHRGIAIVTVDGSADPLIVVSAREFYERLDELSLGSWREDSSVCAAAMRLYAERYHRPATLDAAYLSFRRSLEMLKETSSAEGA